MNDVVSEYLEQFYASAAGQRLYIEVSSCLKEFLSGKALLIGFGEPFLSNINDESLCYAIPKGYKISHWPKLRPFRTVIIDTSAMPFAANSWDTVVLINCAEYSEDCETLFKELFRITAPECKLIIFAFNQFSTAKKLSYVRNSLVSIADTMQNSSFALQKIHCVNLKINFMPSLPIYRNATLHFSELVSDAVIIESDKGVGLAEVSTYSQKITGATCPPNY